MDKPPHPQQSFLRVSSSELEGVLLKNPDPFSYFMLVAFEASGLTRFTLLLILWPVIYALRALLMDDLALRLMIFVSTVGLRVKEIEAVGRAVLPKFYYDDTDVDAWRKFMMKHVDVHGHGHGHEHEHEHKMKKKLLAVVTTKMPRIMVEWFVKQHLLAHEVVGAELKINSFGFATGFVIRDDKPADGRLFGKDDQINNTNASVDTDDALKDQSGQKIRYFSEQCRRLISPEPVIFHDGRLAKRPTPATALFISLWIPIGVLLAIIRIIVGRLMPMCALPYLEPVFGRLHVKGNPPGPPPAQPNATAAAPTGGSSGSTGRGTAGTLFVCTHRTQLDPGILSYVLRRWVPVVTYSIPRSLEVLSRTRTIRLTRTRHVDARLIKAELRKGDLMVCPEGTTCREPFLLRFSALFAELTDRIVPVAINCKVGFFYATTARGWKGLDPVFLAMNPCPVYEVTFLDRLPAEATCSAGKSPYDVANYVQRVLAETLGFECTNLTRKDKYRLLAGNDGTVPVLLSH